jgi:hypothetical protein
LAVRLLGGHLARGIPFGARPATILARGLRRFWRAAGDGFDDATDCLRRRPRGGCSAGAGFSHCASVGERAGRAGPVWAVRICPVGFPATGQTAFHFFSVPASPEQVARDVRSAASKGQICPVTGLCEVPCHAPMRTQMRQVAVLGRAHTKSRAEHTGVCAVARVIHCSFRSAIRLRTDGARSAGVDR